MTEFVDKEKGAKLVKILESGITESRKRPNARISCPRRVKTPLYEFESGKGGNRYSYPVVQKVFDLLDNNGYGRSYVQQSDEELKNRFRAGLNSRDPSWNAPWNWGSLSQQRQNRRLQRLLPWLRKYLAPRTLVSYSPFISRNGEFLCVWAEEAAM